MLRHELETLFGGDDAAVQRWYLTLWASVHGAATMAVEHTVPGLTEEVRRGLAFQQVDTLAEGLRAAAAKRGPKNRAGKPARSK